MANFSKSFNLRNGVQVDDDNLVVNSIGRVGIGTSIPISDLDVRGDVYVSGIVSTPLTYAQDLNVLGFATISSASIGILSVTSSGIVTATSDFPSGIITYFGDGGRLLNLPTSQWLDVDVGLGFTSIYAQGFVGIATIDPRYVLQIGGNNNVSNFQSGVGINSSGDIVATGIITASQFVGSGSSIFNINANNITTGIISEERLPIIPAPLIPDEFQVSGIITSLTHFSGNLVGIASTALDLPTTSNITIRNLNSTFATVGVATVTTELDVDGKVGIQTRSPQSDLHIVNSGIASVQITGATESTLLLGRNLNSIVDSGGLKYGNTALIYPYSTPNSLDIFNYENGNLNYYLDYGSASGVGTGSFYWLYGLDGFSPLMTLTYRGNLGIGLTNPSTKLEVNGTFKANSQATFEAGVIINNSDLIINGGVIESNIEGNIVGSLTGNVFANTGVSTFTTINAETVNASTLNAFSAIGIKTDNTTQFDRADINAISANAIFQQVSVGSTFLVSAVDFSDAGSNVTINLGGVDRDNPGRYMVVPKITNTQRGSLYSDDATTTIQTGSLIYNTSLGRFQGRTSVTGWTDFVMGSGNNINTGIVTATELKVSTNVNIGSGIVTATQLRIGTGVTVGSGIVTATTGYTSGIGTAVQITTVGNRLVFTVPGVGSTSFLLA